jgi:hypothetical protein
LVLGLQRALRNPYWKVEYDAARKLVRLTRTDAAFKAIEDVTKSTDEVTAAFDSIGRKASVLLVDLRNGPMRNDPAFEVAMGLQRPRMLYDFAKIAIVVKTPLGNMQLNRHQREGAIVWMTFNDEAPALAHLGVKL